MATVGEAPTLFLRKATGLVKGWSKFDAFLYSFMSVNFVTLGLFFAFSVLAFVPTGQILPALLISGVFVSFLVVTYAGLISVMPRAGGDYVWQSRVLGGGIAFVLAITGWWFILWYWAPIYGNILNVEVFQPLAAIFKLDGVSEFLASNNGLFFVCAVTVLLAGYLVSLGMEGYARVQKVCFYIGMVALAAVFLVMLFGSQSGFQNAFNQEAANLFGGSGNVYTTDDRDGNREQRRADRAGARLHSRSSVRRCSWSRSSASGSCGRTGARRSTARSAARATSSASWAA